MFTTRYRWDGGTSRLHPSLVLGRLKRRSTRNQDEDAELEYAGHEIKGAVGVGGADWHEHSVTIVEYESTSRERGENV